jgi:hypothetical protein
MVVVSRRLYGPGHQLLVWREVADAWIAAGDAVEVDPPPEPIQEPPIASTLADEAWAVVDAKSRRAQRGNELQRRNRLPDYYAAQDTGARPASCRVGGVSSLSLRPLGVTRSQRP